MAALPSLPNEIIQLVTQLVPREDLKALRQACRRLNEATIGIFAREYFHTRYIMLERRNLEALVSIAEHPSFGPALHVLNFCPERIAEPHEGDDFQSPTGDRVVDHSYDEVYMALLCDQRRLFRGEAAAYLERAAKGLPNCKSVALVDNHFPWGASGLEQQAGRQLRRFFEGTGLGDIKFIDILLSNLLLVSNELQIESLAFSLGHGDEDDSVNPMEMCEISSLLVSPPFNDFVYSSLTSLQLLIYHSRTDFDMSVWKQALGRFPLLFPNLSHFALEFDGWEAYDFGEVAVPLSEALYIPQLRVLGLARCHIPLVKLVDLLLRHKLTLEETTLRQVSLEDADAWVSFLGRVRNMPALRCLTLKQYSIGNDDYQISADGEFHITDEESSRRVADEIQGTDGDDSDED